MKLRMLVGLLSAMSFFHFGELWPAGSHGGGITFEMSYIHIVPGEKCLHANRTWEKNLRHGSLGSWNWARLGSAVRIGAAASHKAVWWDLRLASLLMQLLLLLCV